MSKTVILFSVILMMCFQDCLSAAKSQQDKPAAVPAGTNPERIILTWNSDPAASQAVTWRTEQPCEKSFAQITVATPGPDFESNAASTASVNEIVKCEDGSLAYYHTVTFQNLSPSTLYVYRVGDGNAFSEWNQFRTADIGPKPFKFIYLGDTQNDILMSWSRVIRTAFAAAPDAKFIIHTGDLVNAADNDEDWQEWFNAAGWIFRVTPSIACIGNHEQPDVNQKDDHLGYSIFWRPQFAFPLNGPDDLKEITFYFDYENVRFFVLNGSKKLDEQAEWLNKTLADTHQKWKIAVIHQPLFSTGKDRDNIEIRKAFEGLFDKYNVDIVLQGHDHTYGRTCKVNAEKAVGDKKNGTIYCTSVSGPKQYPWNPKFESLMVKKGTKMQLFQVISINNNKLTYNAYTANQELFDHFVLTKSADGRSVLSE